MNAQKLFTADGKFAGIYFCERCNLINRDKDFVDLCCICRYCEKPFNRKEEYSSGHKRCWHEQLTKRERERLEEAELVEACDGYVYCLEGWGNDGYIAVDEIEEILAENVEHPDDWPEFAFCTSPVPFPKADASELVECAAQGMYEDAYEHITVPQSLIDGIAEYNEVNKNLISYETDWKRKIKLPPIPEELRLELTTE